MSDIPRSVTNLLEKILGVILEHERPVAPSAVASEDLEKRLKEVEAGLNKISIIAAKSEIGVNSVMPALSILAKSLSHLSMQIQALYEALGISPEEALEDMMNKKDGDQSHDPEDPGFPGAGGGMGGMIN